MNQEATNSVGLGAGEPELIRDNLGTEVRRITLTGSNRPTSTSLSPPA